MTFKSIIPTQKTLMGPGPSNLDPRVLQALARPILGHLDPEFVAIMDEIKEHLRYVFQTTNELTFPVSAPGSAGMETCFVNLMEPGEKAIICINGVFGGRMKENVERCGGIAITVECEWGQPIDLYQVELALSEHPDTAILAFVHAETSTGVQSDAEGLGRLAQKYDCLTIMDCVTSLGGSPLYMDKWGIDAAYSGSQKCLSCPPGISPVSFSPQAVAKILSRQTLVQSWFLDLSLVMNYWGEGHQRVYHHTAPVNAMYGLHESLILLRNEGLEAAWARHRFHHETLSDGLEKLGFTYLVEPDYRLPQLNSVILPDHIREKEAQIRKRLLDDYQLEIGGGLGALAGKIWRIGLMGYGASEENVDKCLSALQDVLS